jgi:hypothetical protein
MNPELPLNGSDFLDCPEARMGETDRKGRLWRRFPVARPKAGARVQNTRAIA